MGGEGRRELGRRGKRGREAGHMEAEKLLWDTNSFCKCAVEFWKIRMKLPSNLIVFCLKIYFQISSPWIQKTLEFMYIIILLEIIQFGRVFLTNGSPARPAGRDCPFSTCWEAQSNHLTALKFSQAGNRSDLMCVLLALPTMDAVHAFYFVEEEVILIVWKMV